MKKRRRTSRLVLPPWSFLAGTFDFPFATGVRGPALAIAIMVIAVGLLARESASIVASDDGRLVLGGTFAVLTLLVSAACLAFAGAAFAGACAEAIVNDTANGCDRIAHWPGLAIHDWIGDSLLVVYGFGAAAAAGIGTERKAADRRGACLRRTGPVSLAVSRHRVLDIRHLGDVIPNRCGPASCGEGSGSVVTTEREPAAHGLTRTPPRQTAVYRHTLVSVPLTVLSCGGGCRSRHRGTSRHLADAIMLRVRRPSRSSPSRRSTGSRERSATREVTPSRRRG